jgi:hypothetical protein
LTTETVIVSGSEPADTPPAADPTPAVEAAADAAVEVAKIEADRDVAIAEIAAETVVAQTEAAAEAVAEDRIAQCQSNIESLRTETTARLASLEEGQALILARLTPPEPAHQSQTETPPEGEGVLPDQGEPPPPRKAVKKRFRLI